MSDTVTLNSGRESASTVRVWDPVVRLVHWGVALAVLINSFSDAEAKSHHWVGYAAIALVAIRLIWGLVGTEHARFTAFPPSPRRAIAHAREIMNGKVSIHLSHNPLGALMVYNIWGTLLLLGLTGYMMTTVRFFGMDWVEELHEGAYNWLLLSVALHVGGVVFDTMRTKVPLVPAMLTGHKTIPEDTEVE